MGKTFIFTPKPPKKESAKRAFVSLGDTALSVGKSTDGKANRFWLHQVLKRDEDGNVIDSRPLFLVPEVGAKYSQSYGGSNTTVLNDICREAIADISGVPANAVAGEAFNDEQPPV